MGMMKSNFTMGKPEPKGMFCHGLTLNKLKPKYMFGNGNDRRPACSVKS